MTRIRNRAYYIAYEARRRASCRARGICTTCGRLKRKRGLSPTGRPYANCPRCIDRHAKVATASRISRRRRGYCTSCPRRRPRGDRHYDCPRCRARRNRANRLERAA